MYHGRHVDPQHLAKLVIANNNVWALTVNITKASILLQYLRICINPFARKLCYVLLTMLVPAVCWTIFAGTFLCRPVAKLWDPQLPGHCMNAETYWLSAAGINIALDFLVLIVPLPLLAVLRLPRRQKQCLVTLFLLGFFVCIVSVVRLITVDVTADAENYIRGSHPTAFILEILLMASPESGIFAILWSAVEANTGIICASLFALKPLIGAWCPRLLDEKIDPWLSICLPTTKTDMWRPRDSDATLVATSPTPPQSPKGRVCKERPGAVGRSDPPSAATSPPRTDEVMGFVDMLAEDRRRGSLLTEPSRGNSQPRA